MLLVLTGVTAISVALLAYVNELTKEPIAQANAKTLSDAVVQLFPVLTMIRLRKRKPKRLTVLNTPYIPPPKKVNSLARLLKRQPWASAVN